MCSNSSEISDYCEENDSSLLVPKTDGVRIFCKKCTESKNPAVVVLRRMDAYCRDCFLANVKHKFRASIGKEKLLRNGEKILLSFSGGVNSSALLALVKEGLAQAAHKQLKLHFCLGIVDEVELGYQTSEEFAQVLSFAKASDFDVKIAKVSDFFKGESEFLQILSDIKDGTNRKDFLEKTRITVIANLAKWEGIKYVFLGETLDRLAARVLSDVSIGAGSSIQNRTAFADERIPGVVFLRPLRDVSLKEAALYCSFTGTSFVTLKDPWTRAGPESCIQKLTEKFVMDLAKDFPTTSNTLMKTGGKLMPAAGDRDRHCCYCGAVLDIVVGDQWKRSSAVNALAFSNLVSNCGPWKEKEILPQLETCDSGCTSGSSCCKLEKDAKSVFFSTLCYSCSHIFSPFRGTTELPKSLERMAEVNRSSAIRQKMKDEISEFLLDDG
ncbi:unnamed protein product [Notodromas monacha]|uniref:Cytoplasmic tRNA 2-thiolation protein 2 n=1 Tax=Notodromas monacha TaxID=399045 RepID=A0A7R9GBL9_9CRUS|nr:unnamed protein product [Notodromas monacha]CAG0916667.1 unnamed protein product [Notodromas monacha]